MSLQVQVVGEGRGFGVSGLKLIVQGNVGALRIRRRFWAPLQYSYHKEPRNTNIGILISISDLMIIFRHTLAGKLIWEEVSWLWSLGRAPFRHDKQH